jgi:hypothetical protein
MNPGKQIWGVALAALLLTLSVPPAVAQVFFEPEFGVRSLSADWSGVPVPIDPSFGLRIEADGSVVGLGSTFGGRLGVRVTPRVEAWAHADVGFHQHSGKVDVTSFDSATGVLQGVDAFKFAGAGSSVQALLGLRWRPFSDATAAFQPSLGAGVGVGRLAWRYSALEFGSGGLVGAETEDGVQALLYMFELGGDVRWTDHVRAGFAGRYTQHRWAAESDAGLDMADLSQHAFQLVTRLTISR